MTDPRYADWAVSTFETKISPTIRALGSEVLPGVSPSLWLDTCGPGPSDATRYRLFPGSFFLLWVEALGVGPQDAEGEFVAAALELLHNSSLVHDDVIDGHALRKGQSTIFGTSGSAIAILGGDGLAAASSLALSKIAGDRVAGCLERLALAAQNVVAGQILDEPEQWAAVPLDQRWDYWLRVCKGKLALGNVAGPLAAFWVGKHLLEPEIEHLLEQYSVVSQIINDFGDLLGFSGYHVRAPSLRSNAEEAARKPTLPLIWSGCDNVTDIPNLTVLIERASFEIEGRKRKAIDRLEQLPISGEAARVLIDFFVSPKLTG